MIGVPGSEVENSPSAVEAFHLLHLSVGQFKVEEGSVFFDAGWKRNILGNS